MDIFGPTIYLDANALIYAVEGIEPWASVVKPIFAEIDAGRLSGLTSELTLAEVLVMPLRKNLANVANEYRQLLSPSNAIQTRAVTREILESAATLRAAHTFLRLPDAIHAATAVLANCTSFITNDRRLAGLSGLHVHLLSNLVQP